MEGPILRRQTHAETILMQKRKGTFTKSPAPKRQKTAGTFAATPQLSKAMRPEIHYFDTDYDNVGITNIAGASWANAEADPATVLTLFAPVQGDDIINRSAKRAFVTSIKIRGFIACAAQTAQALPDGAAITRIVLYQDSRTNGAQTQAEDVIASGSATTNNVCAFQNTNSFGKVRVLKEKYIRMGNPNIAGVTGSLEQDGINIPFKMNVKFKKPVEVNFQTNGGTIASVIDNSFHVIAGSNNASLTQTLTYKSRCSFYS